MDWRGNHDHCAGRRLHGVSAVTWQSSPPTSQDHARGVAAPHRTAYVIEAMPELTCKVRTMLSELAAGTDLPPGAIEPQMPVSNDDVPIGA
jgi:hypothetical protein